MREFGKIQLPQHLVKGVGLNRDKCMVQVIKHGEGELRHTNIQCAEEKSFDGCRSTYQLGNRTIYGCPLRSNEEHIPYLLKKNLGIELIQQEDS
jgi:hypothetical protein